MLHDRLAQDLYAEICRIPIIDTHSHIDPRQPTSRTLDDILGYHYYTELAHSSGMERSLLDPSVDPRERVRAVLYHMSCFDNTAAYEWFVEIARAFLDFQGERLTLADCTWLWESAEQIMSRPGWEDHVLRQSNIEKVFLTNEFDDPLTGFNTSRYLPCLRGDDLLFRLGDPDVRRRLASFTGIEPVDAARLRQAIAALFTHFGKHAGRACAVSLPANFRPRPVDEPELNNALASLARGETGSESVAALGVFWLVAELCGNFKIPFDLMIGVTRGVYAHGVPQGRDLFDQRVSLIDYATLFNAFPEVTFVVSVLSAGQNQELVSYSWIFPNVIASGHWWYSNIPAYIEEATRARLGAVPKTKQIGYFSDMYKLEFGLPKFNMYRRILARILADDFIRPRLYTESQSIDVARLLLRDNARRIFNA
jgi:glucuronate isomerase